MSFQVGDITIFPGRGVGKIISIDDIERADGENMVEFRVYRIRFPADPLSSAGLESILEIPFQKNGEDLPSGNNAMRQVIQQNDIQERIYDQLRIIDEPATDTWNRRYRTYQQKIGSGDCSEIASILRELATLRNQKELSFGERKMYDQAIELLMDEVAYSQLHEKLQNSEDYIQQQENCSDSEENREQKIGGLHNQLKKLEKQWKAKKIKTKDYRPQKTILEEKLEIDEILLTKEVEKNAHRLLEIESQIISDLRQSVKYHIEDIFEETKPEVEVDPKKKKKTTKGKKAEAKEESKKEEDKS